MGAACPNTIACGLLKQRDMHKWTKNAVVVAFLPIVHNSGSHDEVKNLGLTTPNQGNRWATRGTISSNAVLGNLNVMGHLSGFAISPRKELC